jgi:uncharacterized membrane protein YhiD involved in acid resistance
MNPLSWLGAQPVIGSHFTFGTVLLDLLLAFVLGQFLAWLYGFTHRGLTYSRNMIHSMVLLCMIVAAVMMVVGDSVARAFGLVGALAIVRFRTVVRDARDTTFIFLALAIGIAVGVQQYGVALAATLVIGGVATLMHFTGFATRHADTGVLRVRGTANNEQLAPVLAEWCRTHELLSLKEAADGSAEYSFEIRLYHPTERTPLIEAVRNVAGTITVTVAMEERAEEW